MLSRCAVHFWIHASVLACFTSTHPTQPPTTLPPLRSNEGPTRGPGTNGFPSHETVTSHTTSPLPLNSILERMASVPDQSFPDTWQSKIGAPVIVYTGGDAQKWRVSSSTNPRACRMFLYINAGFTGAQHCVVSCALPMPTRDIMSISCHTQTPCACHHSIMITPSVRAWHPGYQSQPLLHRV